MALGVEPDVVAVAREVWADRRSFKAFHEAFAQAIVFVQRPERPALFVTDVPGQGRWTLAFSALRRLAACAGQCDYVSMPGAELLGLVPAGVGVMLDPEDEHRFPVLTRIEGSDVLEREWKRSTWARQAARGDERTHQE